VLKDLELCPNPQTFLKKSLTKNFIKVRKRVVFEGDALKVLTQLYQKNELDNKKSAFFQNKLRKENNYA